MQMSSNVFCLYFDRFDKCFDGQLGIHVLDIETPVLPIKKKQTITTEVINVSDWKQMSDCKVKRQQIKCELRAVIELLTLDRWVQHGCNFTTQVLDQQ